MKKILPMSRSLDLNLPAVSKSGAVKRVFGPFNSRSHFWLAVQSPAPSATPWLKGLVSQNDLAELNKHNW
jgi:hypothetical protein